jgi:DNA-binding MarR family transcriptional regulator
MDDREKAILTSPCEQAGAWLGHPAATAWIGMVRLVQRTEQLLAANLRRHRLNPGQLDILVRAGAAEGLTQQELAERLCHSKANVSQMLDKLEAAGLVRRVPEGRAYAIHLTDEGRQALGAAVPALEGVIADQFAVLTVDEQRELIRLMAKLEGDST